jgi:hypothetical protein
MRSTRPTLAVPSRRLPLPSIPRSPVRFPCPRQFGMMAAVDSVPVAVVPWAGMVHRCATLEYTNSWGRSTRGARLGRRRWSPSIVSDGLIEGALAVSTFITTPPSIGSEGPWPLLRKLRAGGAGDGKGLSVPTKKWALGQMTLASVDFPGFFSPSGCVVLWLERDNVAQTF